MKKYTLTLLLSLFAISSGECAPFVSSYNSYGQTMYKDSFGRGGFNNPNSAMISSWMNNDIMNMGMRNKLKKMVQDKQNGAPAPAAKAADYRLTDISAPKQNVAEQLVNSAQGISPEERKALLTALKEGIKAVEKELPRKNNLAYAMAGIVSTAIYIGKGIDVPGEDVENLATGFNNLLTAAPEWKKTPAATKQNLYETTVLNMVLMILEMQAEDQATKDIAVETANNILASFGVNN